MNKTSESNQKMQKYFLLCAIAFSFWWGSSQHLSCACQDRSKTSSIRANMHTFQTTLETYAVDWGGVYPRNAKALAKESTEGNYWKDFKNPVHTRSGYGYSYIDREELLVRLRSKKKKVRKRILTSKFQWPKVFMGVQIVKERSQGHKLLPGIVIYDVNEDRTTYFIYSMNPDGKLMTDRGQPFVLSNS